MGLFDNFREKNGGKRRSSSGELPERRSYTGADGKPMQIRHPRSFADVEEIIDRLKDNLTVIVYLNELSASTAARVTDILSGAIYALGGGMAQLQKDVHLYARRRERAINTLLRRVCPLNARRREAANKETGQTMPRLCGS